MMLCPHRHAPFVALALLVVISLALLAGCGAREGVRVEGAWVRAAGAGETTAAYLTLVNDTPQPVTIVAAAAGCARASQLHTMRREGGVFTMQRADSLVVPAHARLALAPGAGHVMLIGLWRTLLRGEHVPLVVRLADGRSFQAIAEVRP